MATVIRLSNFHLLILCLMFKMKLFSSSSRRLSLQVIIETLITHPLVLWWSSEIHGFVWRDGGCKGCDRQHFFRWMSMNGGINILPRVRKVRRLPWRERWWTIYCKLPCEPRWIWVHCSHLCLWNPSCYHPLSTSFIVQRHWWIEVMQRLEKQYYHSPSMLSSSLVAERLTNIHLSFL